MDSEQAAEQKLGQESLANISDTLAIDEKLGDSQVNDSHAEDTQATDPQGSDADQANNANMEPTGKAEEDAKLEANEQSSSDRSDELEANSEADVPGDEEVSQEEIAAESGDNSAPAPSKKFPSFVEEVASDPAKDAKIDHYARLYDDEQRSAADRFRWSVGGASTQCTHCHQLITSGTPFYTVLAPASEGKGQLPHPDLAKVFERQDHCRECFDSMSEHDKLSFAHWQSVLPAPEKAPKKIVNLASLRAYFDRVTDALEAYADETQEEKAEQEGSDSSAEQQEVQQVESSQEQEAVDEAALMEQYLLQYMLGLFLVRKRKLRWQNMEKGRLTVDCKQSERVYELHVPGICADELANQVEAFAELFE